MMSRRFVWGVVVLAAIPCVLAMALVWTMPDRVPTHWGLNDRPDAFGSRWTLVSWTCGMNVFVAALMLVIPAIGPMQKSFERFRETYGRIMVVIMSAIAIISMIPLMNAAGWKVPVGSSIMTVLGVMLAAVGNWMGKVRRNFWVGIRTPWTLANDTVWERTHRAGGKVIVAYGLAIALAGLFLSHAVALVVVLAGAVGLTGWCLIYSYIIYRRLGSVDDMARHNGMSA